MLTRAREADALLLASGSAATAWFDAFGATTPPIVVSIGPSTTAVATRLGIEVHGTAHEQSLEALVEATEIAFFHH
jgi:uroporphyrinogen-III synthase